MEISPKEIKLKIYLIIVYLFILIGVSTPAVILYLLPAEYHKLYQLAVLAVSVILIAWFQKLAHQILNESAAFAIPGQYELRQKYLLQVNRLEWTWLILAILAVLYAAIST